MKLLMILTSLLPLNTSYACPDLSGKYTCVEADVNRDIEVSQSEEMGVTTYNIKDSDGNYTLITDGSERPQTTVTEGNTETTQYNYTASCEDQKVATLLKLNGPNAEIDQADLTLSKEGDVIKSTTISSLNGKDVESTTTYCVPRKISESYKFSKLFSPNQIPLLV